MFLNIKLNNNNLLFSSMLQNRFPNGLSSGRKQQTAVKHTVDRPKNISWYNDNINHQNHHPSIILNPEDNNWLKSSTKIFDDIPELELTCQDDMLSEVQLQNYPTQVIILNFHFLKYFDYFYLGI